MRPTFPTEILVLQLGAALVAHRAMTLAEAYTLITGCTLHPAYATAIWPRVFEAAKHYLSLQVTGEA
jgi:hypothetical protein